MKIAIMPCRSIPRGVKMLFGCLLLCLLTCMPAAAQAESFTPFVAPLKDYAELSFTLPTEVAVEPESIDDKNYTEGRYVVASLLLNGSRISLYLIYPCQAPEARLDAAGLKALVDSFEPGLNQTVYSPSPLNVSGQPAIWGQIGNQILVAYQPSNETLSLTFIDENVTDAVMEYLLGSLQIIVNDASSPLWPGYCAGDEVVETTTAQAVSETTQAEPVSNKEQMIAELDAITQMMDARRR